MALPNDVTTFTLVFGPYTTATGGADLAGLRAQVLPVDPVTGKRISVLHVSDGQTIMPGPAPVTIDATGTATVVLPHTDQQTLSPVGFAYSVVWFATAFDRSPGNRRIAVPQASGNRVSFDLLNPAPSVPGVQVPVAVGPTGRTGDPGPAGPTGPPGHPPPPVELADAPVVATDATLSDHFRVTVAADRTLGPPTNPVDGARLLWEVTAAGGDRVLTLDPAGFVFGSGLRSVPTILSGTTTFIGATYRQSSGRWHVLAIGSGH